MARNNARLTHAQYDTNKFNDQNDGYYSLPNGADQRFIEVLNGLSGVSAWFSDANGDVMVRYTDYRSIGEEGVDEAIGIVADRFNMTTGEYSTEDVVTFEYSPE